MLERRGRLLDLVGKPPAVVVQARPDRRIAQSKDLRRQHRRVRRPRLSDGDRGHRHTRWHLDGRQQRVEPAERRRVDRHADDRNNRVRRDHTGQMRGGDSFFFAYGSYTAADGKWKGEVTNEEHSPTYGERPIWERKVVTIGFTGSYTDETAEGEGIALAGKQSIRFRSKLRLLVAD